MDAIFIEKRIEKLEQIKASLLKLKKEHRNNELKQVNDKISRLKGWLKELKK